MTLRESMSVTNERSFLDNNDLYYSITIKPLSRSKVYYKHDLEQFIKKHYGQLFIIIVTYEVDHLQVLHAHILAKGKTDFQIKNVRYWHQYCEKTRLYERYISYCKKHARNQDEQDQILLRHWSYHDNLFNYIQ